MFLFAAASSCIVALGDYFLMAGNDHTKELFKKICKYI